MQRDKERQAEKASRVDLGTEAWQAKPCTIKVTRQGKENRERRKKPRLRQPYLLRRGRPSG